MSQVSGTNFPLIKKPISSLDNMEELEGILRKMGVELVEDLDVEKLQLSVSNTKIEDDEMTNVYDNIGFNHQALSVDWISATASEETVSIYICSLVVPAVLNHNERHKSEQPLILQCDRIGAYLLTANPAAARTVMPSPSEFVSPPSLPMGASASCSTHGSSRRSVGKGEYNYLDAGIVHRRNTIGLMTEAARPDSCLVYIEVKKDLSANLTGATTNQGLAQLLGGLYNLCVQRLNRQQRDTTATDKEGEIKVFGILTSFVRWIFVEFVMISDANKKAVSCEYRVFGNLNVKRLHFWLEPNGKVDSNAKKYIEGVWKHLKYVLSRTARQSSTTTPIRKKRDEKLVEESDGTSSTNSKRMMSDQAAHHHGDQSGKPNPKKQKKAKMQ